MFLLALYPIAFAAGWLGWFWFVVVPPISVFLILTRKAGYAARHMRKVGIGEVRADRFLQDAVAPIIPISLWNGFLYGIALAAGWGLHRLVTQ